MKMTSIAIAPFLAASVAVCVSTASADTLPYDASPYHRSMDTGRDRTHAGFGSGFTTDSHGNLLSPPFDRDEDLRAAPKTEGDEPRALEGFEDRRGNLAWPEDEDSTSEVGAQSLSETVDQDDMDLSGFSVGEP